MVYASNDLIDSNINRTYLDLRGVEGTPDRAGFLLFQLDPTLQVQIHFRAGRGADDCHEKSPFGHDK